MLAREDRRSLTAELDRELSRIREDFTVTRDKLKEISRRFEEELKEGLEQDNQNISMHPTWVCGLPTGRESGDFVTLDLGGTNIRVCHVKLHGKGVKRDIDQAKYKLPEDIKTSDAGSLWDFVADDLKKFLESHSLHRPGEEPIPFGFCFSYPAHQDRIDHGVLKTWTKGFDVKGVEGEDVAAQLKDAIEKRDLPLKLVALVNDTTGALVASAYTDPDTLIGAIFGTGCNAAYVEDVGSIPKLKTTLPPETPMVINCEYGAFDNAHRVLPRTKYDQTIDEQSPRPGEQSFEKMSAGLYLGEIFRLVVLDLHERGVIFKDANVSEIRKPYRLDTEFLSAVENESLDSTMSRFRDELGVVPTPEEAELLRQLGEIIAVRSARLCSCGIAAICRMKRISSGHVAADGSVANKHPEFKGRWAEALGEVLDWPESRKEDPITIISAEDGSGIGAAIITAMTLERNGSK
ncbi:hexokinase-domain-containing protein [Poronia punctata]|nr:hexokinase-domain-containing protein [Poronia punctata]